MATADDLIIDLNEPVSCESTLELPLDVLQERVIVIAIAIFFKWDSSLSEDMNYFAARILDSFLMRDGRVAPFIYPEAVKPPVDESRKAVQRIAWKIKKPS